MKKAILLFGVLASMFLFVGCGNDDGGETGGGYALHTGIMASTFWVGEGESADNGDISNVQSSFGDWGNRYTINGAPQEDRPQISRNSDGVPNGYDGEDNPYYFALPYDDMSDLVFDGTPSLASKVADLDGNYAVIYDNDYEQNIVRTERYSNYRKENAVNIPWYSEGSFERRQSVVKGRWIKVRSTEKGANGEWVYAQWLDTGPFYYDDFNYVFGTAQAKNTQNGFKVLAGCGIDLSPAVIIKMGVPQAQLYSAGTTLNVDWQFVDEVDVPDGPWKNWISDNECRW